MKKYINGQGFLTEEGKQLVQPLLEAMDTIIKKVDPESENQYRTLGSVLLKLVGDRISNGVQEIKSLDTKYDSLTDEQFEDYLKDKYGEQNLFVSLEPDELKRYQKLIKPRLAEVMKKIQEDLKKRPRIPYHGFNPRRK